MAKAIMTDGAGLLEGMAGLPNKAYLKRHVPCKAYNSSLDARTYFLTFIHGIFRRVKRPFFPRSIQL